MPKHRPKRKQATPRKIPTPPKGVLEAISSPQAVFPGEPEVQDLTIRNRTPEELDLELRAALEFLLSQSAAFVVHFSSIGRNGETQFWNFNRNWPVDFMNYPQEALDQYLKKISKPQIPSLSVP